MNLYEAGLKNIDAQIEHWEIIRRQYVLFYYARKEGYKNLGLQPLPALTVSEYKAKEAIQLVLLLKSLKKSPFGNEDWTLTETSAELLLTPPRNCFKKDAFIVDVYFDHNPQNSFPYTNWDRLYVQDEDDRWYLTSGQVDYNGLYFVDNHNEKSYFTLFTTDAERYGTTGEWTVKYKNEMISASVDSSRPFFAPVQGSSRGSASTSGNTVSNQKASRQQEKEGRADSTTPSSAELRRRRRRDQQREYDTRGSKRRRTEQEADSSGVPASQVGRRHRTVPTTGLTRLERLEREAEDPPVLLLKGRANALKCWRNRCDKYRHLFTRMSTVWKWAKEEEFCDCNQNYSRLLVAFNSIQDRSLFLQKVNLPKGCTYSEGNLASL